MIKELILLINRNLEIENGCNILSYMLKDFSKEEVCIILKKKLICDKYNNIKSYEELIGKIIEEASDFFNSEKEINEFKEKSTKIFLKKKGWRIYGDIAIAIDFEQLELLKNNENCYKTKNKDGSNKIVKIYRCKVKKCNNTIYKESLCRFHYYENKPKKEVLKSKKLCSVKGCFNCAYIGGLCNEHYENFIHTLGNKSNRQ